MKRTVFFFVAAICGAGVLASAEELQITSSAFSQNGAIPAVYTCDGAGNNPALAFSGAPPGTKSLAVVIDDPDVPWILQRNHLFVHWVKWDLPPDTPGFGEGRISSADARYTPPCPPDREHRYVFKLFALDTMLGTDRNIASADDLYQAMSGHTLARAELVGRYKPSSIARAVFYGKLALPVLLIAGALYWVYRGVRAIRS
jgi:Raf kinase inhibitor-like YbhB/YbcL family protein